MCIVIDLDVVCLVCLHNSQEMHAIFAPDSDTPDLQIAQKISTLSKLKVSVDNESLPDKICESCLEDLKAAWRFHKNCQTAAVVFQSIFKPKLKSEKTETSTLQEKGEIESNQKTASSESHTQVGVNCDDSVIEGTLHDATLDESQVLEIHETSAELEFHNVGDTEFFDMNQSIVEEDYLSVPETVDEESDLVEYYLTDDGLQAHQEESLKKPSTSKNMEKIQIVTASSSRKSLLRSKREKNVQPSPLSKKKHATYLQSRERSSHTQSLPKLKLKPELTQHRYQNSEIDDDFDLVPKISAPQKRKLSPEPKAPKICELCGNSYRYQHALNAHMRRHFQEKIFPCELCDKGFVSNVELRRHMRVHTGDKPYGCQYCDRRFSDFGSRIKHERTHTGERPYHCTTCGKSFAYPHVLSVHLRTHTGEKRFQCQLCTKGFTKKAYLITHMGQHHSGHQRKAEDDGAPTTYEPSIGDTIIEAGEEENESQSMKSLKFEDCMYTTEYVNDGDVVSHEGDDDEVGVSDHQDDNEGDSASNIVIQEDNKQETDNSDDDGDASSNILTHEDTKQEFVDEDNNEVEDEVVEVQIDDYTIRVR